MQRQIRQDCRAGDCYFIYWNNNLTSEASEGFRGQIVADAGKGHLAQLVLYLELFIEQGKS